MSDLTDARLCELFVTARSLSGLAPVACRTRAELALVRYRSLFEQPRATALASSNAGRWLLAFADAASPDAVRADELVVDFVTSAVWHAQEHTRPLTILARAFDWRLRPLLLALSLHARAPTVRSVDVAKWLLAHTRPGCADELAISFVPTLKQYSLVLLQGRDRSRACALELLGEVALRAPAVSDALAPFFWSALLLDSLPIKEQAIAICFDVLFVLLARGALAEGSAARAEQRGFAPLLAFLPRMLLAPSALAQRAAVAGVARLCWHAFRDERFEKAVSLATSDECFCDHLLLPLVARYGDVRPAGGGGGASARLTEADEREILLDLDLALSHMDPGQIADCAVYLVARDVGAGIVDVGSARGYGDERAQLRRALHELVRRLGSRELRDGLPESICATCDDLFGVALEPERVRGWLALQPAIAAASCS